jgi:hypothetical protein
MVWFGGGVVGALRKIPLKVAVRSVNTTLAAGSG